MDNNIKNIQDAIVNAYKNGSLQGKTPEEAAQILYDFGGNMYQDKEWRKSGKPMFDIPQTISKEELHDQMRKMFKGTDKEFEEGFEVFFSVFDQTGDGYMETAELTLFDNDDGDAFINSLTLRSTLYTENLANFVADLNETEEDDSVGDTASFTTKESNDNEAEEQVLNDNEETANNTEPIVKENDISDIKGAIVNADYSQKALQGKTPEEVAQILYDFGGNMYQSKEWRTNGKPMFDIPQKMSKEELHDQMRKMYKGTDEDFEKGFEVFFAVFDQTGDGYMETAELTLLDNDDGDAFINSLTLRSTLYTDELANFTSNTQNSTAEPTANSTAEETEAPTSEATDEETVETTAEETEAPTSEEKTIRDIPNAIAYADYTKEALQNKSPQEVAQILQDFGENMYSETEWRTKGKPMFDLTQEMSKQELHDQMRKMFKGTDEEFEKGFEVFFAVFDQTGDGYMGTSELTLFDNADGDKFINSLTLKNTLSGNISIEVAQAIEVKTAAEAEAKAEEERIEAERIANRTPEEIMAETLEAVQTSISTEFSDTALDAINELSAAYKLVDTAKRMNSNQEQYKEQFFSVITSLYDEDSDYSKLPPEQKLGVLVAAIQMNGDLMKEYFLEHADESKVVLVKLFNELAEKAVSPEGGLNDAALKNLELLTSSFDGIFAGDYSRKEDYTGLCSDYETGANYLRSIHDKEHSYDAKQDIGHLPDQYIYNFMSYIGDGDNSGSYLQVYVHEVNGNVDSQYLKQYVIDNISNLYANAKSVEDFQKINDLFNLFCLEGACKERENDFNSRELTQIYTSIVQNEDLWNNLAESINLTETEKTILEKDKDIEKMGMWEIMEAYNNGDYSIDEARYIIYTKIKNLDLSDPKQVADFVKTLITPEGYDFNIVSGSGNSRAYFFEDFMNLLAGTKRELPTDEELDKFYGKPE